MHNAIDATLGCMAMIAGWSAGSTRRHSVVVITADFESVDPSSNLGGTFINIVREDIKL